MNSARQNKKTVRIGNIGTTLLLPDKRWESLIAEGYSSFVIDKISNFRVSVSPEPNRLSNYKHHSPQVISCVNKVEIVRSDFYSVSSRNYKHTVLSAEPDKYTFDSWFRVFISLVTIRKKGLLLHASSMIHKNNAYIFPGRSGAGKSTIIKITGRNNALSDEISYVFKQKNKYYASSTPFWGELNRPKNAIYINKPLKAVFFIKHGKKLGIEKLDKNEALKELLKTVLFFSKQKKDIDCMFSILVNMINVVPAYVIKFTLKNSRKDICSTLEAIDEL